MSQVEALQRALAAEHAAVYVLAELGGRVSVTADPREAALIRAAYDAHRGRRDRLQAEVTRLGEQPVAPAPGYVVDSQDRSGDHLVEVALRTEQRCTEAYAELVGGTTAALRRWAVGALTDSARRTLTLGARPTAFPGCRELA